MMYIGVALIIVAITAIGVAIQYFIINFLQLTDEEIKTYNEHVYSRGLNPMDQNILNDRWPPFIL